MGDTSIEWTRGDDGALGKSWNPIRGCTRISEGCRNCYAESVAARFSGPGMAYEHLAVMGKNGPRWTGKLMVVSAHMDDPIRWRKPKRIFVNSMSDLFHERLPAETIARVFRVMLNTPRHTFQVLTKRAQRMCEWVEAFEQERGEPLPDHIHLGASAEDQPNADERLPWLEKTRARVKFVSVEPQIGPIKLRRWLEIARDSSTGQVERSGWRPELSWVIVGGESGRHPRPFDVQWARDIVADCRAAGVPCFVKQLGGAPFDSAGLWEPNDSVDMPDHGPPFEQWDPSFSVRQFPTRLVDGD